MYGTNMQDVQILHGDFKISTQLSIFKVKMCEKWIKHL